MATVYRARDRKHDAPVALKLLRPELASYVGPARFDREIRITAQLQHSNIVPVFDSGIHEQLPFYVMPLVEGESLAARLAREGVLGVAEAVRITCVVARALSFAHARGIVHRDVKPANILLHGDQVLLADFGVARAVTTASGDSITDSGIALGTTYYMSPEQSMGATVDHRADQYSLACVLYELLAGSPPFTGPAQIVVARHSMDTAPTLHNFRRELPEGVEQAVHRALAKVAGDRFDSVDDFAAALEAGLAAPVTHEVHVRRRGRRVRWAALLGAGAAAVALWFLLPVFRSAPPPLDRNRVMVFPLVLPAGFTGSPSAGEDAATIIGSALDGTDPLRWSDGWSLLTPEQRDDMRRVPLADLTRIAAERRCAWMLIGRVVMRGDSVSVALELHDVADGTMADEKSANGPAPEPWRAALQAVGGLLPTLVPEGARALGGELGARPPAAIASFLLGEAAFRRVNIDEAFVQYERAVRADSTFALAALRAAQAASWRHRPSDAASMIARTRGESLAPRFVAFAAGFEFYLLGAADSAAAAFRRAISDDPEMSEAWAQLGEVYTHLLPLEGNVDTLAEIALAEARRLDPAAKGTLLHLIELRLRAANPDAATPLVVEFLAAGPDSILGRQVQVMHQCATRGADAVDWRLEATVAPLSLLFGAMQLSGGAAHLPCAARAYRAILATDTAATDDADNRRFYALLNLLNLHVATGDAAAVLPEIEQFVQRWGTGSSLFLHGAPYDTAFRTRALAVARDYAGRSTPAYRGIGNDDRLWQIGLTEASVGDLEAARSVERELRRRAVRDSSGTVIHLANAVEARIALRSADTTRALALLERLVPAVAPLTDLQWSVSAPLMGERLLFAQLLHARGEHERAIAVASVLDAAWPSVHLLVLRESLVLREAAATALGRLQWAGRFRQRLAALMPAPGPAGP